MTQSDFVFLGYLVQERYLTNWWKRSGMTVASLENATHPSLQKPQWKTIGGVLNPTEFLLTPPDMSDYPGFVLCGYAIEREAIERLKMMIRDRESGKVVPGPPRYEYALHLTRSEDGLSRLGYEVMDARIDRLSILNNCGYTVEQWRETQDH